MTKIPLRSEVMSPSTRLETPPLSRAEPQRSSRLVTRGPVPLYAEAYGDPFAPGRVLCIHGAWQSLQCWHQCAQALAQAGSYVVSWDLPFHGLSGPFDEKLIPGGLWATSMQALIEEFDLQDVIILAWSFGGLVLGDYLRQYSADGIAGIILVGTALLEQSAEETWLTPLYEAHPFFAAVSSPDRQARLSTVPPFLRLLTNTPVESQTRYHLHLTMQAAAWRSGLAFEQGRTTPRPLPDLSQMPVLSLGGEHDPCFPPDVVEATRVVCPRMQALFYPCGHTPMLECPHLFQHDVQRFVHQHCSQSVPG